MDKRNGRLPIEQVVKSCVGKKILRGKDAIQGLIALNVNLLQNARFRRIYLLRGYTQHTADDLDTQPLYVYPMPLVSKYPLVVVGEDISEDKLHSCQSRPWLKHCW